MEKGHYTVRITLSQAKVYNRIPKGKRKDWILRLQKVLSEEQIKRLATVQERITAIPPTIVEKKQIMSPEGVVEEVPREVFLAFFGLIAELLEKHLDVDKAYEELKNILFKW